MPQSSLHCVQHIASLLLWSLDFFNHEQRAICYCCLFWNPWASEPLSWGDLSLSSHLPQLHLTVPGPARSPLGEDEDSLPVHFAQVRLVAVGSRRCSLSLTREINDDNQHPLSPYSKVGVFIGDWQ